MVIWCSRGTQCDNMDFFILSISYCRKEEEEEERKRKGKIYVAAGHTMHACFIVDGDTSELRVVGVN